MRLKLSLRYRLEHVEQDNPLQDALASTLRTRITSTKSYFDDALERTCRGRLCRGARRRYLQFPRLMDELTIRP